MSKRKIISLSVFLATILFSASIMRTFAQTPSKTVDASGILAYNIKGLKRNLVVQNFYIATTYLYVTQCSGGTVYLTRLLMNGNNATYVDEMTFTNCGHAQTLDMYTYNGINYFYVSSKDDPSATYNWSLQVARTTYIAGATVNYTDLHRITYMNYANKTGVSLGTTYRVDGGGNSTYTIFRVQTTNGGVTWAIYDTVALNKLLDNNKQVQLNTAAAQSACVYSFTQTGSDIIRPNGSFQGVDMVGSTRIYTSGGHEGHTPQIAKMSNTGIFEALVRITNVGDREIEGVQTRDNNVYFCIVTDPVNKRDTQQIYYVPESIF